MRSNRCVVRDIRRCWNSAISDWWSQRRTDEWCCRDHAQHLKSIITITIIIMELIILVRELLYTDWQTNCCLLQLLWGTKMKLWRHLHHVTVAMWRSSNRFVISCCHGDGMWRLQTSTCLTVTSTYTQVQQYYLMTFVLNNTAKLSNNSFYKCTPASHNQSSGCGMRDIFSDLWEMKSRTHFANLPPNSYYFRFPYSTVYKHLTDIERMHLKVGLHYPSSRPEFTGRVDGPRTRVHFWHPSTRVVETGRPCTRAVYTGVTGRSDFHYPSSSGKPSGSSGKPDSLGYCDIALTICPTVFSVFTMFLVFTIIFTLHPLDFCVFIILLYIEHCNLHNKTYIHTCPLFQAIKPIEKKEKIQTEKTEHIYSWE